MPTQQRAAASAAKGGAAQPRTWPPGEGACRRRRRRRPARRSWTPGSAASAKGGGRGRGGVASCARRCSCPRPRPTGERRSVVWSSMPTGARPCPATAPVPPGCCYTTLLFVRATAHLWAAPEGGVVQRRARARVLCVQVDALSCEVLNQVQVAVRGRVVRGREAALVAGRGLRALRKQLDGLCGGGGVGAGARVSVWVVVAAGPVKLSICSAS